ncbi:MAG: hypothetical protein FJW34_16335 [Acidobacteria bacterium]|nr:hypothetical protein [Acidobacteriota bacterium]
MQNRHRLREEAQQWKLLARTFWERFFDNELVAMKGEMQHTLTQIVALLTAVGTTISLLLLLKYSLILVPRSRLAEVTRVASWADKTFFLAYSMVAFGFLTVLCWDALFPDRRDAMVLTPLPLKTRTVFLAKQASLAVFLLIFAGAINLLPALLFPLVASPQTASRLGLAGQIAAHLLSTLAASAFVFFVLLSLHGLLISVLSHRQFRRVAAFAQLACLFSLLALFFLLPQMWSWRLLADPERMAAGRMVPPLWFLGLYEVLQGAAPPVFRPLAKRALWALALAAASALVIYAACYRRHVRRSLEAVELAPEKSSRRTEWVSSLVNRLLVRRPTERACFHFILKTMARSRHHRLFLAGYLGVGLAYVAEAVVRLVIQGGPGQLFQPSPVMLAVSLVLLFFVLVGMRVLFTVPAELHANWIFQLTEHRDRRPYLAAVRKAVLAVGVAPLVAVGLLGYALLWGWAPALKHALYCLLLALLLMEGLLLGFRKIPFTCSYLPGKANLKVMWPFYWVGFSLYAVSTAGLEAWLWRTPWRFAAFVVAAAAALAVLVALRRRRVRRGLELVYEEAPEPTVRTLDLQEWPAAAGL